MKFNRFGLVVFFLVVLGFGMSRFMFNKEDATENSNSATNSGESAQDKAEQQASGNKSPPAGADVGLASQKKAERPITSVKTKDLTIGASKKVDSGNKVSYHVVIQLMDGKVVFNSRSQGKPWSGTVGDGSILNGIDRGIRGMYQGGKRAIWIPALFAYGSNGISGQVPPDSDLYAEVEVVAVY